MAVKTNQYSQPLSQDTSRGPSQSIWNDCPSEDFVEAQGAGGGIGTAGMSFFEDFRGFPDFALYNGERQLGQWDAWVGNNSGAIIGTAADTTNLPLQGGVIGLIGGTTAIDITMTAGTPSYRLISPATGYPLGGKLWFEASVAVSSVTSAYLDLFVGLMDAGFSGTHITSAASLCFSATNTIKTASGNGGCLGFWKRATTNPTDVAVVYNINNGTAQLPGSSTTLQKILTNSGVTGLTSGLIPLTTTNNIAVAQSFVKLGYVFDPTPSCPQMFATSAVTANQTAGSLYAARVRFFLNGQLLPWFLNTADVQAATFPSSFMVPTIGYRSGGTGDGIGYCDWVRVAQLATF